jgi:hypothetical protein
MNFNVITTNISELKHNNYLENHIGLDIWTHYCLKLEIFIMNLKTCGHLLFFKSCLRFFFWDYNAK